MVKKNIKKFIQKIITAVPSFFGGIDKGELKMSQPSTVQEAVQFLIKNMTKKDQEYFINTKFDDLIQFHHGLGMWIRNNFGLWTGNDDLKRNCLAIQKEKYLDQYKSDQDYYEKLVNQFGKKVLPEIMHADDASFIIIQECWKALQNIL